MAVKEILDDRVIDLNMNACLLYTSYRADGTGQRK